MYCGESDMRRIPFVTIVIIMFCVSVTGMGILRADDTEIYGTVSVSLPPNVLIIFDNSGSMNTADIPGEYYNAGTTYSGSYSTNKVYYKYRNNWRSFADNIDDLNCEWIKEELQGKGYVSGAIRSSNRNYACGGSTRHLRTGNYMNYDQSGVGANQRRIDVAKEVVKNLINDTENVRFGLFIFNNSDGGHLVCPCGTNKATLISSVNSITAGTWTPLAETLAEAGLYYAGQSGWFNNVTYTSPMQERCQKNYIVLMTDGAPTMDDHWRLTSGAYINGDTIGDYDNDGNDPGWYGSSGTDYLDDVAKYLYENDCNPTLGAGTSYEKQRIITYTIGFTIDNTLLSDTAQNGGGEYFTANSVSGLSEAFEIILSNISEANAVFVAPVVPVNRMNRTYSGDYVYLGFFRPQQAGRWVGNLKKYKSDSSGDLVDVNDNAATLSDGRIKENAQSYWSPTADGPNVAAGGVGEVMLDQTTRNIYTYMSTQTALTHTDNAFLATNSLISPATIGVTNNTEKSDLIDDIYGGDRYWILGDILHSEPAIVHYSSTNTIIYAGSNDGIMHCFDDSNGEELWGFIPPDQLERLSLLSNNDHDYFVDGSPVLYDNSGQMILFFGERRGGDHYYALDVTTATSPKWLYKVNPDILGSEILGQSWSRPGWGSIKTTSGTDTVFLITGGYDTNQDLDVPSSTDTVGRAVFAVKVGDGTLSSLNFNASNYSDMTHCIVDASGFDTNSDDIVNSVYAGDLGGNMFAFEDIDKDGTWSGRKLFAAPVEESKNKKIFYAPDAVKEQFGEMIFFGTGDRADPGDTDVVNRIYAVKNNWADSSTFSTLTESDLVDVTEDLIQMGTDEEKAQVSADLTNAEGWYIKLTNSGEKVVSTPTVYAGVVYFTTYTPDAGSAETEEDDPCAASTASGTARLYAVDYLTGGSVLDYSSQTETDEEGEVVERGIQDRSKTIGAGIPSQPVIAIRESGPKMYIGTEGGIACEDPQASTEINAFYWRQMF
jgi:type IV pilus assembly protein PilY1